MPNPTMQTEFARHALGLPNTKSRSFRNWFTAPAQSPNARIWGDMVVAGNAELVKGDGRFHAFSLTEKGALGVLYENESLDPEDFPRVKYPVFVYGTLKSGHGNNRLLADAHFSGEAVTVTPFRLVDRGIPFACREGADLLPVLGELYEVSYPELMRLDGLEGVPWGYQRTWAEVKVIGAPHTVRRAFIYTRHDMPEDAPNADVIFDHFVWRPDQKQPSV